MKFCFIFLIFFYVELNFSLNLEKLGLAKTKMQLQLKNQMEEKKALEFEQELNSFLGKNAIKSQNREDMNEINQDFYSSNNELNNNLNTSPEITDNGNNEINEIQNNNNLKNIDSNSKILEEKANLKENKKENENEKVDEKINEKVDQKTNESIDLKKNINEIEEKGEIKRVSDLNYLEKIYHNDSANEKRKEFYPLEKGLTKK